MQQELLKELKNISILCVEDEDGIREMIVSTLKYYFNEVYEARDGYEAYELYDYYKPKIVLTDIQMKNCNGLDFVKKIRETDTETMIIMLTAYSNEEYLMELINLNINHFILKPLNTKKLTEALEKYYPQHPKSEMKEYLQYVVDDYSLRIIALDTFADGHPNGLLTQEKLDWFEDKLKNNPKNKD